METNLTLELHILTIPGNKKNHKIGVKMNLVINLFYPILPFGSNGKNALMSVDLYVPLLSVKINTQFLTV